ncbi:S1C family serine protease [Demequina sp. NBRC 110054]|uniref:S1C family serine protease n=1 Tax=Demequina sp. NBRC 110054 TaxID=1570343 RepID=UPI000A0261C9|nr:trypsin-like peptidase domain-containing protein [Demequina sp. NBRC 110054]
MTIENWQPADDNPQPTVATREPFWRSRIGRFLALTGVSTLALTGVGLAYLESGSDSSTTATSATDSTDSDSTASGAGYGYSDGGGMTYGGYTYEWPSDGGYAYGGGSTSGSTTTESTQEDATTASDDESTGIVIIETVLGYESASAAGTGVVLSSDGLILTNNHVIEDSTEITVTIPETGETYTATVVGTDADNDVALLQLEGASGLTTATLDDDVDPYVGDTVTAVGNAEGGGVLMAADGTVTELESTVTTSSEYTIEGETLDGMIEFEADVVSGDSGGALLDDEGEVVGITTAASTGLATTVAYAIPIDDALDIVDQILAGDESGTVEIGYPAFLGIGIAGTGSTSSTMPGQSTTTTTDGVEIGYVYEGTGAAEAGLVVGDVIAALDGTSVTSGDELSALIADYEPGDTVTVTYTDTDGATQTVNVILGEGPAA